jgi:PleD family two-component response regulator
LLVVDKVSKSKPSSGPTVLIVDDDLGFISWLGAIIHEVGYRPVPALCARQALSLVEEFSLNVAVVVLNPELEGIRTLIRTLNQAQSRLVKVILIRDPTAPTSVVIHAHAILERPCGWESESRHEWLGTLSRILAVARET